jgi:pyruvate dehydrogenase E2 component (dihydrolipoamide acetyltransferase)
LLLSHHSLLITYHSGEFMSTEIVMPQMGESIAEGTITRWLKKVGEHVERDEPLFEISTDKVDAEIPSPAAGTLSEIKFNEGDTVEVNTVVAILNGGDGASASAPAAVEEKQATEAPASQAAVESEPPPAPEKPQTAQPAQQQQTAAPASTQTETAEVAGRSYDSERPGAKQEGAQASAATTPTGEQTAEELRRTRSSPLVRNIAKEHGIDISRLEGTGMSGRVTKNDILSFIESGAALTPQQAMQGAQASATQAPSMAPAPPAPPTIQPAAEDRVEQMSMMRKKIADHMIMSRRTSAHVTTVYEIDMTRIARLREKHKREFQERVGTKLSYMPLSFRR